MNATRVVSSLGAGWIRHPLDSSRRVRAVLFDLDGTLYRQKPVQIRMALELAMLPFVEPFAARSIVDVLRRYRHAQEALRASTGRSGSIADAQIALASEGSGLSPDRVKAVVDEWMIRRPLKYLRAQLAPGARELLDVLHRAGVPVGVLSDYPAVDKLQALGLAERFSPILCSSDPGINQFKPNPRGFCAAAEYWNLPTEAVLMVGDRYEVDVAGARAAGMPCILVGKPTGVPAADVGLVFPSLERLAGVIDGADDWSG